MTQSDLSTNTNQAVEQTIRIRRAFRSAIIILVAAIGVVAFYAFFGWQLNAWQLYTLAGVIALFVVATLISARLIRKGQVSTGTWIIIIGMYFVFIFANLMVADVGAIYGLALALLTFLVSSQGLAPKQARLANTLGGVFGVAIALIDLLPLDFRLALPAVRVFIPAITGAIFLVVTIFFARRLWRSGRLRNRVIVALVGVLSPVLIISAIFTVQTQRQELETLLFKRAEASAITGAQTIGHLLEDAIETSTLTEAQVFDTNYVMFWEFDPAMDPNYDPETAGEPESHNKYHTSYDAYTDEHWQELLDSYLTQADILFAVPVDINGYLPTHNTLYASGDGSAATDRTKRIFNDPVGLAAAQNTEPTLRQVYARSGTGETLWDVSAPIYVNGQHWGGFRVAIELGENQERVIATTWRSVITATVTIAILVGFAWFLGRYISTPIERLTEVATQAADGDFQQHIEIPDRDEITVLAGAFNTMIGQLRDLIGGLEQRITERTRALETSTEVGRRLSTILDERELVREVVEQIQSAFDYYHAHIYLFDDAKERLLMVGGTGSAGRTMLAQGHSVPKGRGLVGRAADTNLPVLVPDVSQAEGWLPNPLLPETKAETAIPIAVGEEVLGVLDVQDNEIGGLTDVDVDLLQSIGNQVAVALQNSRAYRRTQEQVAREALMASINQQIQGTTDIEAALKVAVRELGRALETDISVTLKQNQNDSQ